jgi:hypothetical protein
MKHPCACPEKANARVSIIFLSSARVAGRDDSTRKRLRRASPAQVRTVLNRSALNQISKSPVSALHKKLCMPVTRQLEFSATVQAAQKLHMRGVEERGTRRTLLYAAVPRDDDNKADGDFSAA